MPQHINMGRISHCLAVECWGIFSTKKARAPFAIIIVKYIYIKRRRGYDDFFRGLSDRQIEEMLNDSIWRKLRLEWAEGCNRSSKLHYWAGVCGDLVYKEWQDGGAVNIVNRYQRRLISEFRSGCPKLEVETGRWQKKEREERLCSLCHKAVGDISHFLSECEALDGERKALKSILRDVTNETFASEVLNSIKDNRVVKEVVKM